MTSVCVIVSVSPPIGTSQTPLFVFVEPAFSFHADWRLRGSRRRTGTAPFFAVAEVESASRFAFLSTAPRTAVRRICWPWVRGGRNKAMPPASRVVLRSPSGFDLPGAAAAAGRNGIKPMSPRCWGKQDKRRRTWW